MGVPFMEPIEITSFCSVVFNFFKNFKFQDFDERKIS